jgi:hypothetical protein
LETYVFRERPEDVETAMLIGIPGGGFLGVMYGFHQAEIQGNGYVWRPLGFGALGAGTGLFAGVHYKKFIAIVVGMDVLKSLHKSSS